MFDTALNSLCILICGLAVILSVISILRTDNLATRIVAGAAGVCVLVCRWSITLMVWSFIEATLTLAGLALGLILGVLLLGFMIRMLFRW